MNQLAKSYAGVYLRQIKKDIKKYGRSKAIVLWEKHKQELKQVHNDFFMDAIEEEFKRIQNVQKQKD